MLRIVSLYALVLSIPLALGAAAAQANRFDTLKKEMAAIEKEQEALVDTNKRLLTEIAALSSPVRIEDFARNTLMLDKKEPEDVLQIHIYGAPRTGGAARVNEAARAAMPQAAMPQAGEMVGRRYGN